MKSSIIPMVGYFLLGIPVCIALMLLCMVSLVKWESSERTIAEIPVHNAVVRIATASEPFSGTPRSLSYEIIPVSGPRTGPIMFGTVFPQDVRRLEFDAVSVNPTLFGIRERSDPNLIYILLDFESGLRWPNPGQSDEIGEKLLQRLRSDLENRALRRGSYGGG